MKNKRPRPWCEGARNRQGARVLWALAPAVASGVKEGNKTEGLRATGLCSPTGASLGKGRGDREAWSRAEGKAAPSGILG